MGPIDLWGFMGYVMGMEKKTYQYLQTVKFPRGHKWKLRRNDGKLVYVSRKRFNQLADQSRLTKRT